MATRRAVGLRAPVPPRSRAVHVVKEQLDTVSDIQTVGVLPEEVDLIVYQGDDVRWTLPLLQNGTPADLSGCTLAAQIRVTPSDDTILATITITVASSNVSFWLAGSDSAGLPKSGAVWDAQVTDVDGFVSTFVAGNVLVTEQVTRT